MCHPQRQRRGQVQTTVCMRTICLRQRQLPWASPSRPVPSWRRRRSYTNRSADCALHPSILTEATPLPLAGRASPSHLCLFRPVLLPGFHHHKPRSELPQCHHRRRGTPPKPAAITTLALCLPLSIQQKTLQPVSTATHPLVSPATATKLNGPSQRPTQFPTAGDHRRNSRTMVLATAHCGDIHRCQPQRQLGTRCSQPRAPAAGRLQSIRSTTPPRSFT